MHGGLLDDFYRFDEIYGPSMCGCGFYRIMWLKQWVLVWIVRLDEEGILPKGLELRDGPHASDLESVVSE